MVKSNAERVISTFAVDFQPLVGAEARISAAAELIQSRLKTPYWGTGPSKYVFRDTTHRMVIGVEFRRVFAQNLGAEHWVKALEENLNTIKDAIKKLGVSPLSRVGCHTAAFLQIAMSHAEMVDLMFGSFLMPSLDFQEVCGKPEDALVQIHGEYDKMKVQVDVVPMTKAQVSQTLFANQNLDAFVEPKYLDTGIKEFHDRIAMDSLHVAVDLHRTEMSESDIPFFGKQALDAADKITDTVVQKLKNLRSKKRL